METLPDQCQLHIAFFLAQPHLENCYRMETFFKCALLAMHKSNWCCSIPVEILFRCRSSRLMVGPTQPPIQCIKGVWSNTSISMQVTFLCTIETTKKTYLDQTVNKYSRSYHKNTTWSVVFPYMTWLHTSKVYWIGLW